MKKYIILVVLAVAACATVSAQDRIGRMFNQVLNGFARYERLESNIDYIRQQTGMTCGRGKVTYNHDYRCGIIEERYQNRTAGVWTANYYIRIADLFVSVYKITPSGLQQTSYLPRQERYGDFWIADDVVCGNRTGLRLNIINNMERTMVWIWNGDNLYNGVTVRQAPRPGSRGPRYGCNGRRRW